jgi:hypothetical protein
MENKIPITESVTRLYETALRGEIKGLRDRLDALCITVNNLPDTDSASGGKTGDIIRTTLDNVWQHLIGPRLVALESRIEALEVRDIDLNAPRLVAESESVVAEELCRDRNGVELFEGDKVQVIDSRHHMHRTVATIDDNSVANSLHCYSGLLEFSVNTNLVILYKRRAIEHEATKCH